MRNILTQKREEEGLLQQEDGSKTLTDAIRSFPPNNHCRIEAVYESLLTTFLCTRRSTTSHYLSAMFSIGTSKTPRPTGKPAKTRTHSMRSPLGRPSLNVQLTALSLSSPNSHLRSNFESQRCPRSQINRSDDSEPGRQAAPQLLRLGRL